MTDRELLEAAAKAAGIEFGAKRSPTGSIALYLADRGWWNPLADDGDALRLAVKLLNWPLMGRAFTDQVSAMYAVGKLPADPYAATRRAIVRAVAAMAPKNDPQ